MYMLASAWSLVWKWLEKLAEYGLEDTAVKARLRRDESFRSIYLVLYHLVQMIAEAEQNKFAVLATSAGGSPCDMTSKSHCILLYCRQNTLPTTLSLLMTKRKTQSGCSTGPASRPCTNPSWTRSSSNFACRIRGIRGRSCYSCWKKLPLSLPRRQSDFRKLFGTLSATSP